jgi:hypothetical protein
MLQNKTWMRYSLLGISLLAMGCFPCCKKTVEPEMKTATYVYVNGLQSKIWIEAYGQGNYNSRGVQGGESILYLSQGEAAFPFVSCSDVPGNIADSVIVKFSDGNCVHYKNFGALPSEQAMSAGLFNLKKYDDYSDALVSQKSYTLHYTIDSADYALAVPCP